MSDEVFGRCALPEGLIEEAGLARWTKRSLRWTVTASPVPSVSLDLLVACYEAAWQSIQRVCGIKAAYTETARDADVLMGAGRIDGRGGTLAWSELPNGSDRQIRQMYDVSESWSLALERSGIPQGAIPLLLTAKHELGHCVGLPHRGTAGSVMQPSLNLGVWDWGADDIRDLQSRYGPPVATPPVPAPDEPDVPITAVTAMERIVEIVRKYEKK